MGTMGGPTTVNPQTLLDSARAVKFDVDAMLGALQKVDAAYAQCLASGQFEGATAQAAADTLAEQRKWAQAYMDRLGTIAQKLASAAEQYGGADHSRPITFDISSQDLTVTVIGPGGEGHAQPH